MVHERRSSDRCPTCKGPMKEVAADNWRCRNSLCAYNHRLETCPRCQHQGPEIGGLKGDSYSYNCPECMNKWTKVRA